jgi:hypothetical protein
MLRKSGDLKTRTGDFYWRIGGSSDHLQNALPIWSSEVDWLISELDNIAVALEPDNFPVNEEVYPLAFRPIGKSAILLALKRNRDISELWIERWSAVNPGANNPTVRAFSTYWYCNRPFLPSSRLKLPLNSGWKASLRGFANKWAEDLRQRTILTWEGLRMTNSDLPAEPPPRSRIVVACSQQGHQRRIPFYPSCQPHEATVLDRPLRRVLLEACSEPLTYKEVARRVGSIDSDAARNELTWTSRYDNETLSEAAFLVPMRSENVDRIVATMRAPSFLADPLLSALAPVPAMLAPQGNIGPSPQRPDGLPLEKLRSAKLLAEGTFPTSLGDYPLPTPKECENTRAAAKSSSRLRQERWLVLQWLDVESRCQLNTVCNDRFRRVLGWQKLALLRFDCATLFDEIASRAEVDDLLTKARERHALSMSGAFQPSPLLRSKNLPR